MTNHILSVDLEDWNTSALLREYAEAGEYEPHIEESTRLILELFEKKKVKATFFALGSIAEKHPGLIKEIFSRGHEMASHGYSHTPMWKLSPSSFRDELLITGRIIETITGKKPKGFRAPYASLDNKTAWTVDILEKEGYQYDSSVFPMKTPLYGTTGAPRGIYRISSGNIFKNDDQSQLIEIPFTISELLKITIPCTGGIYGRFLPVVALKWLLRRVAVKRPVNFYFHPWEILRPDFSKKIPPLHLFLSYYNSDKYLNKIEKIIETFSFMKVEDYLNTHYIHPKK